MATISSSRRLNDQSCDRTALLLQFGITVCIHMIAVWGGGGGWGCCGLSSDYIFFVCFRTDNFYTVKGTYCYGMINKYVLLHIRNFYIELVTFQITEEKCRLIIDCHSLVIFQILYFQ